ncbi:MAG: hypothetical protein A2289_27130 [Deltaproteobacteria bacterium RIFOXYA12_FULL_58_15]|nr:MAG: hypothetical protein A2289_27130 [Deltaproteobacteria bacterium RIFOXYA12_FULL_58_15]OGR12082.1 MAG: hypothetical protein A2341_18295 [Deltaproteobacteria bacterium RIFOXYB12_FULL_58_9]
MPLTPLQSAIVGLLAQNRSPDSYLAGGAALHIQPQSKRYSNDLDYFHDSEQRVAQAFAQDRALLEKNGFALQIDISQPGYVRVVVRKGKEATKVEWAHDSAWRFLPTLQSATAGYVLHPIDLAINKVLALVGRDEPRDYLDVLHTHAAILPLGAQCWAAAGKDPGFTPVSLLEMLRRRGKYQPEDFSRLHLSQPVEPTQLKKTWLDALAEATAFVQSRPPAEIGCLYYSESGDRFVQPTETDENIVPHFGRPGGVLPRIVGLAHP